jgi:hypothetical protein
VFVSALDVLVDLEITGIDGKTGGLGSGRPEDRPLETLLVV